MIACENDISVVSDNKLVVCCINNKLLVFRRPYLFVLLLWFMSGNVANKMSYDAFAVNLHSFKNVQIVLVLENFAWVLKQTR